MEKRSTHLVQSVVMPFFVLLVALFALHFSQAYSHAGQAEGLVNLNTATAEQLESVPNIGKSKAEAIVQYRKDNGDFKTVEDVKKVKGIGDKLFEKIKDHLTIKGEISAQKTEKPEKAGKEEKKKE